MSKLHERSISQYVSKCGTRFEIFIEKGLYELMVFPPKSVFSYFVCSGLDRGLIEAQAKSLSEADRDTIEGLVGFCVYGVNFAIPAN